MKKLIVAIIIAFLYGCEEYTSPRQIKIEQSTASYEITLLFEVDSIKVYRFFDNGREVYFSSSQGRIDYEYTTRVGKTGVIHHTQTTLTNQ